MNSDHSKQANHPKQATHSEQANHSEPAKPAPQGQRPVTDAKPPTGTGIQGERPQTGTPPVAAVVSRLKSPSLPQVDLSSSENSHGTSESRDKSATPDSEVVIDETVLVKSSPNPPPPALIRPTNNNVRAEASSNRVAVPVVEEGRRITPRPTAMEERTSSRYTGSTPRGASRQPRMEGMSA